MGRTLFPLGALCGAALAAVAVASLDRPADSCPADRPAGPARHLRLDALSRVFLLLLGAASAGISIFAAGYFRQRRGHGAGTAVRAISSVSRQHGLRSDRRRRVRVHAGMGDHGAVVLLSGDHAAPHPRDSQGRISLPADRPPGRDRHPALLRSAAGRQLAIHLRCHARRAPRSAVGHARVLPRAARLWRQGGLVPLMCGCRRRILPRRRRFRR